MPTQKKINKNFFKTWTADMAYVIGFFAADGYMTVNKRGGQFWCIQITDKKLLEKIKSILKSEHKISTRRPKKDNEKNLYRIQVGSIEMCNDLRKLGFTERKTHSLGCPPIPDKWLSSFMRGYFDGDGNVWVGYVHKQRKTKLLVLRTVFTSCSKIFLESIKERMNEMGIVRGVISRGKGEYYRLTYSIHNSLKLYTFMYNGEVKDFNMIYLPRKKKVFDRFIKMRP